MFDSSPIEVWEGASAVFSFGAGSGMTIFLFWLAVVLCVVPLYFTLKTENRHEDNHK
jgi:hypothetical protein